MEHVPTDQPTLWQGKSDRTTTASPSPLPSELQPAARNSASILIVDDCRINRRVAALMLKQLGYPADVVESGREALSAIGGGTYALVLMDVQMPEMDGLEATRRIRQAQAAGSDGFAPVLRIVAFTTSVSPEDRAACFSAGMDDHLAKPVSPVTMLAVLEKYLSVYPDGGCRFDS